VLDWAFYLDSEIVGSLPAGPPADRMVPVNPAPTDGNGVPETHLCRDIAG